MIMFDTKELAHSLRLHSIIPNKRGYTAMDVENGIVSMATVSPSLVYYERIIHPEGEVCITKSTDNDCYFFPGNILKEAVKKLRTRHGWGQLMRNTTTTQFELPETVFTFQYDGKADELNVPDVSSCMPEGQDLYVAFYMSIKIVYELLCDMNKHNLFSLSIDKQTNTYHIEELVKMVVPNKQGEFANLPIPEKSQVWEHEPITWYNTPPIVQFDIHVESFKQLLKMFNADNYRIDDYVHCVIGKDIIGLRNCVNPLDTDILDVYEEGWVLTKNNPPFDKIFYQDINKISVK